MMPEEWPIAAQSADPMVDPAHARGPGRLTTVRRDFFLDPAERLSEQERALMSAMLHDLIASLVASIRATAGAGTEATDPASIATALGRTGLLDRPQLIRLMLRRADEHRIMTAFAGHVGRRRLPLLPKLIGDSDPAVAAAAMVLVVARGRRRDGFGQPRLDLSDLPRADALALAHAVAAFLSPGSDADASFAAAADKVVEGIDEDHSLDRAIESLVEMLDRTGRADEGLAEAASGEGDIGMVAMIISCRSGLNLPEVWDHLLDTGAGGLALMARMAGFSRQAAARLIADLGSATGNWSVEEEIGRFDSLGAGAVTAALKHGELPPDYRAAVKELAGHRG